MEICINCKGLIDIILFLTNLFFTRRLPRSTTLRLLKHHRNLSTWRSTLYRLTILQCLIACMCFHSNEFHAIVHHVCEYVYFQRTPSSRGSRIKLKVNLIKVTMFIMSDDLFRYLFHLNYVCSDLYYFLLVHCICLAIMTPQRGLMLIMELLLQVPECKLLCLCCYIYVISCTGFFGWRRADDLLIVACMTYVLWRMFLFSTTLFL